MNLRFLLLSAAASFLVMCSPSTNKLVGHYPSAPSLTGEGQEQDPGQGQYEAMTTEGTLIRTSCADPCMVYENGMFYLTMTGSSNLVMVVDSDLNKLNTNVHPTGSCTYIYRSENDPNVEALYGKGASISGTWSPELHYISEDDIPGYSGWYLVFGLRKSTGDSSDINTVVMKSKTGSVAGPYVNPVTGVQHSTQTLVGQDGKPLGIWNVGMSILRIPSGKYKGIYGTYVDEVGRGTGYGNFYQRLRIAKLEKPWQLGSELCTITHPTQSWEKKGASGTLPMVVEGGTAVYGDDGEVFMAYCGSGYWSDYGLGQLTLKRENGDYCDPLKESSWIKYEKNPLFSSASSSELRGAGHAFFLKDDAGNRFMCYHAYPYSNGTKGKSRNAYIEPYTIDYSMTPDSAPQGVIKFGVNKNSVTGSTGSVITFYKKTH